MSAAAVAPASAAARARRSRSALWPLARAEGRRLLRHPIFLLGMAITIATTVLASGELERRGVAIGAGDRTEIVNFLAGDCFVMLGAAFWTFLATFLAASRERRDGAEDFYAGQPVRQPTRTAAALLSVGYAGLAAAALIAVSTLVLVGVDGTLTTERMRFSVRPVELLQGPLYVVMAGALGVLVGSWSRHVFVGAFAAIVLFLPPVALVPWFVLDDDVSRGFYGAIMVHQPLTRHMLLMVGVTLLAASLAIARSDRRPRVAALAGTGLAAVAAIAIAAPGSGLAAACSMQDSATTTSSLPPRGVSGNLGFERGNLSGWSTRSYGSGGWHVYSDGTRPPDLSHSDPMFPFSVPDPPQGRFAAVVDMCSAGSRFLYRDLELDGRRELRFTILVRSYSGNFSGPPTLDHAGSGRNHQFRVDVMKAGAPISSVAGGDVLATIFRTRPYDGRDPRPRVIVFDLSRWAGETVRLRFAEVDNDGPLRVVVDDVRLDAIR